jgi:hyaluronoglucosaminidase
MKISNGSSRQESMAQAFEKRHVRDLGGRQIEISVSSYSNMSPEAFAIEANVSGSVISASIKCNSDSAFRWALNALRTWIRSGSSAPLTLEDKPDFRWRGVIEGFYGNPWSHEQRLRGAETFGDFGMNVFMIAPKDSQWQRFQWRSPLTDDFVSTLKEIIDRGLDNGVAVSACVSPGLSVEYSNDADVAAVVHRFAQQAEVGAVHFGLLLDDIPDTLTHPGDIARYPDIATAHADFANRVREGLIAKYPHAHLVLCPMHYAGRGTEPYLLVMGDHLHPQIELMWTGRDICSGYLDISDAVIFDRSSRRPPFYWDNYPVNDGNMARRLHVGPITGREAGLHKYGAGLLSNPSELFECSLIPLFTIGDYLWSTTRYDAMKSWDAALNDLISDDADRAILREFFRNSLGLTGGWAPAFNEVMAVASKLWRSGQPQEAGKVFHEHAAKIARDHERLTATDFSEPRLQKEIQPWLALYKQGSGWLEAMAQVLDATKAYEDRTLHAPQAVREQLAELRKDVFHVSYQFFGDATDGILRELEVELTFDL